jgi:hypothetical protein
MRCPLTKKLMHDPVVWLNDGMTYEKSAIVAYIRRLYSATEADSMLKNVKPDTHLKEKINKITQDW